jgi:hypothetical protein
MTTKKKQTEGQKHEKESGIGQANESTPASEVKAETPESSGGPTPAPEVIIDSATAGRELSEISELDRVPLPAARGKAGVLGGPKDRGIKADDKLALPTGKFFTLERVVSLNPKSFYCAMRWDYRAQGKSPEEGKRWWANKKILVTNPETGKQVVVRAVDYGPHENTGLTISLSPGAIEALGIELGDEVVIAFADQKAPLGVV